MRGARAVQHLVLEAYPDADIGVSIVWINMLPEDDSSAAQRAAQTIDDGRVQYFHDPSRRVGRRLASSLGEPKQIAWDMYLFYSAGVTWGRVPPQPVAWAHQLSDLWADHFHYGDDMEKELAGIAKRLLGSS